MLVCLTSLPVRAAFGCGIMSWMNCISVAQIQLLLDHLKILITSVGKSSFLVFNPRAGVLGAFIRDVCYDTTYVFPLLNLCTDVFENLLHS